MKNTTTITFLLFTHSFKVVSHNSNAPNLLRPLPFIVFILQHNPPAYYTPYNSAHEIRFCRNHPYIMLIGINGKPLAAVGKFSSTIVKLMVVKTLATNGEEISNAVIGNDVLAIYW